MRIEGSKQGEEMTGKDLSSCSSSFAALFPEKKMNCVRQRSRGREVVGGSFYDE